MKKIVYITNKSIPNNNVITRDKLFFEAAKKLGVDLKIVYSCDILTYISNNKVYCDNEAVNSADYIIFNDKDIRLSRNLEFMGKKVFNSSRAIEWCDSKALMYQIMLENNIPFLDTSIAPLSYFYDYNLYDSYLNKVIKQFGLPVVVKEFFGSQGKQIYLCNNKQELVELFNKLKGNQLLVQKYDSNCAKRNVRLDIIDNKVVASIVRHSQNNDFRTNYSAGAQVEPYTPTQQEMELGLKTAKVFGCVFSGIDIFEGPNGPMICEINSNAGFDATYAQTGVNVAEKMIEFCLKQ